MTKSNCPVLAIQADLEVFIALISNGNCKQDAVLLTCQITSGVKVKVDKLQRIKTYIVEIKV